MKKSLAVFPNTLAFWLPLALWVGSSIPVGHHLYALVLAGDRWGILGLLVLATGGCWALPQSLAGLPAGVLTLFRLGVGGWAALVRGAIAAGVVVALTLPDSDRVREPERKLTIAEVLAAGWTLAMALQWSSPLMTYLPPAIAPWALGGLAGGWVSIGPQLRSSGLKPTEIWSFLGATTALSLGMGSLWGALVFRPTTEWL